MKITVLFFASLRELAGAREMSLDLPSGASVDDAWSRLGELYPPLSSQRAHVVTAVNQEFAGPSAELRDGDEVALLPPVSGGGAPMEDCWLTDQPLNAAEIARRTERPSDGGVVTFEGIVRDNSDGRCVRYLEYEAYAAMAVPKMREIVEEAARRWPETRLVMAHRTGRMDIGDASVVVVASSPHRLEAFQACQFGIDTLKQTVPIWKKEVFLDGSAWREGVLPGSTPER